MATLTLITEREFRASRYGQIADQIEGDLDEIIAQAEAHVQNVLNRTLASTAYTELHRPTGDHVFLRHRPIISVTSVERRVDHHEDWAALDAEHYEVEPNGAAGVVYVHGDDVAGYEVQVAYTAGYATIPWDIKSAVMVQTVILSHQDLEVYGQGDSKEPGIGYLQKEVDRLLKPYRKVRVL